MNLRGPLARFAAALLAYKILFLLLVFLTLGLLPNIFHLENFNANFHWPEDQDLTTAARLFKTWDAQHYLYLSQNGYSPGGPSNNFFPLWPALIRLGGWVLGGDHLLAGVVLSNFFSWAGISLFFLYALRRRDEKTAENSVLLLLACPGALFFGFPYSESLFLLLSMGLFLNLSMSREFTASICAFLLALTRPQGVFAALPIWASLLRRGSPRGPRDWLLGLSPLLGAAVYLLFMRAAAGDAWAGPSAFRSDYPFAPSLSKLLDFSEFLRSLSTILAFHSHTGSFLDRAWFLLGCACLPSLWRDDRVLFWYALPMLLVPAMTLSFVSFARHFILAFPVFLVAGKILSRKENPWLKPLLLGALLALQTVFMIMHVNSDWVG